MFDTPIGIILIYLPLLDVFWAIFWLYNQLTPEKIVNYITKKMVKKELLTKIDFEKSKDYYRDILYNHSIIELSYIDDFEIDLKKEIASTLLSLELKKKIKITDSKIEIINKDDTDLKLTEKDVFNSIENGKVVIQKSSKFLDLLQKHAFQESTENKLLEKTDEDANRSKIFNVFIIFTIIVIIVPLFLKKCFYAITYQFDNNEISLNAAYIYSAIICILLPIYMVFLVLVIDIFIKYKNMMINLYKRTKSGNELNEKIEGLKNYIRDYSLLDEREKESLALWDEYLIYSVEFKQNKDILKKISKLIEIDVVSNVMKITKKELLLATMLCILFYVTAIAFQEQNVPVLGVISIGFVIYLIKKNS